MRAALHRHASADWPDQHAIGGAEGQADLGGARTTRPGNARASSACATAATTFLVRAAAQRERQLAPTSRSVLVSTSCTSRTFGPLNISRGGRLEWASAKSLLSVQATKSAKVRHQVFTS